MKGTVPKTWMICLFTALLCQSAVTVLRAAPQAQDEVCVTYLGNEGFLLQKGERRIMFDGLHTSFDAEYQAPSAETAADIIGQESPFDGPLILFISHHHRDHFDPALVRQLIESNQEAVVVSTPQVVTAVRAAGDGETAFADRLRAVTIAPGQSADLEVNGLPVTAFATHHSTYLEDDPETGGKRNRHADVQHLVFEIEVDGTRILHTGDLDLTGSNRDHFNDMDLAGHDIDLALLHIRFLFSEYDEKLISQKISPRKAIFMHISPDSVDGMKKFRDDVVPEILIFENPLDRQCM